MGLTGLTGLTSMTNQHTEMIKQRQRNSSINTFNAEIVTDADTPIITQDNIPEDIKHSIIDIISKSIYDSKMYKIDSIIDVTDFHNPFKRKYRISIKIAKPDITNTIYLEDYFKIEDNEFTEDEIKEAVKDYYAERFI